VWIDLDPERCTEMLAYQKGLVESTLAQTLGMKGNRDDGLRGKGFNIFMQALKEQLRQGLSQMETPRIF
jgi:hypothetical protein